jgi:hypothetical protein
MVHVNPITLVLNTPIYGPNAMWKIPTSTMVSKGVFNNGEKGLIMINICSMVLEYLPNYIAELFLG